MGDGKSAKSNFNLATVGASQGRARKTFHAIINIHVYRVYKSHDRKSAVNNNLRCMAAGVAVCALLRGRRSIYTRCGRTQFYARRAPGEIGLMMMARYPNAYPRKSDPRKMENKRRRRSSICERDARRITVERWWAYLYIKRLLGEEKFSVQAPWMRNGSCCVDATNFHRWRESRTLV